jgi:hypothetical protein
MAKPDEVLIVLDDTGNPTRAEDVDTEVMEMYKIQKQLIINLSRLDWDNMKQIMQAKLEKQLDGSEWSFENINSLSWAIGSISGTLPEHEEKTFLIQAIRVRFIFSHTPNYIYNYDIDPVEPRRASQGQGKQGNRRIKYHVRRRTIP